MWDDRVWSDSKRQDGVRGAPRSWKGDFRGGGLGGGTCTTRPEVGSWERGSGVEEWVATGRKSTLTRVAWSLRTGPRADLVPDHVTVGLSHCTNFLPRPRPPQTNFITLTSGLTNP